MQENSEKNLESRNHEESELLCFAEFVVSRFICCSHPPAFLIGWLEAARVLAANPPASLAAFVTRMQEWREGSWQTGSLFANNREPRRICAPLHG
jgi:hypothetical protein